MSYPNSQSMIRVPFGDAVELDELNTLLEDKLRLHLAAKRLYRKVAPLDSYCGDCSSVQEDEPRGLCATHAGKCQNCAAGGDLHDGEPSRTKVDAAGNPVVERYCDDCDPPTLRSGQPNVEATEAEPWSLHSEEEQPRRIGDLTIEEYSEHLRLQRGAVRDGPRGPDKDGDIDWQDPGLLPWPTHYRGWGK
jgi:hypothetical protein